MGQNIECRIILVIATVAALAVTGSANNGFHKESRNRKIADVVGDALANGCEENGADVG